MTAPGCLLDPFKSRTQTQPHEPKRIESLMHEHSGHSAAWMSSNPGIVSLTGLLITYVAQWFYTACHGITLSFPTSDNLKIKILCHQRSTANVCSHTNLRLAGTILTSAGGNTVPRLRGPRLGLFREEGAFNNLNPDIFPPYTCVLHQHVITHRCGCSSALFLANCHHITPWYFHIVTGPRRGMLQQNMTKYFSRADGQDFVSTHGKMDENPDIGFQSSQQASCDILTRVLTGRLTEIIQMEIGDIAGGFRPITFLS